MLTPSALAAVWGPHVLYVLVDLVADQLPQDTTGAVAAVFGTNPFLAF